MKFWERFTRRQLEVPAKFKRMAGTMQDVYGECGADIDVIATFIHAGKTSYGITEFSVAPLSCSRREIERMKRENQSNLSVTREVRQCGSDRRMDCTYELHYYHPETRSAFSVVVSVYVTITRTRRYNADSDNLIQDMCNLLCLGYIQRMYPGLSDDFHQNLEKPTIPELRRVVNERARYNQLPHLFETKGIMIQDKRTFSGVPTDENETVGQILGMKTKNKEETK